MEKSTNFSQSSINELTIDKLTIDEPSKASQENAAPAIPEHSQENPEPESTISIPEVLEENPSIEKIQNQRAQSSMQQKAEPPKKIQNQRAQSPLMNYQMSLPLTNTRRKGNHKMLFHKVRKTNLNCEENPEVDIAGPSSPESQEEKPSVDITEAPAENPSDNNDSNFRFEIKPAGRLKLAMEALADLEFNPIGRGRIDIDERGFGITVVNPRNIIGHLWLKATGAQSFECSKRMMGKLVHVRQISQNLVADDQDTVTVSHTQGSNEICFTFGEEPPRGFTSVFLRHGTIPMLPEVDIFCQAAVTVKALELVIEKLFDKNGIGETVIVDIMKNKALIQVGKQKIVHYQYDKLGVEGTDGMVNTKQRHIGRFYWTHPAVLHKAGRLFPGFVVSFTSKPRDNVMLRFTLKEHGELMFLKKTVSLVTDIQDTLLD